jgi:FkbM family methyltransferase
MKQKIRSLVLEILKKFDLELRNRRFAYTNPLEDVSRILAGVANPVIFDVGANRGDTVAEYQQLFPDAHIYAFEPTPELVDALNKRFQDCHAVKVIPKALSDTDGIITFHLMSNNVINSILPLQSSGGEYYGVTEEKKIEVSTTTGMKYCAESCISRIHFLKLDVQGAEKLVLEGFKGMLEKAQIEIIYLELTFSRIYKMQTTFGDIENIMDNSGYRLYGFYDFNREGNGCLDYCNALYVSPEVYTHLNSRYLY